MEDNHLLNHINQLPEKIGIYLFKDKKGKYLYIGKSKNLRKRILQHYNSNNPKENQLINEINKIDFILTPSEVDGLILEQKKIKELKPKYNVWFKDDKSYPFIKITSNETYPRVLIERKSKTGELEFEYIGPFTHKPSLKKTMNYIRTIFPIANCRSIIKEQKRRRPCLEYGIKRCLAPCYYKISEKNYNKLISYFKMFFEGKGVSLINELEKEMQVASNNQEYEKAALIRDRIVALKRIVTRRVITGHGKNNIDFITNERQSNDSLIGILSVNKEGIANQNYYYLKINDFNTDQEIYESFIVNHYKNNNFPDKIIIDFSEQEFKELIKNYFVSRKKDILVNSPNTDFEKEYISLIKEATKTEFRYIITREYLNTKKIKEVISELNKIFPKYVFNKNQLAIEGYDISTLKGNEAVGAKVLFHNGIPVKNGYRRYKIKTVDKQDDFGMMEEIISRRFKRSLADNEKLPDLILVDGGKGQLNTTLKALRELGLDVPIISLAKKFEEIYIPSFKNPIRYPQDSPMRILLQYVRDEAHRFAVTYHRKLRSKKNLESVLEDIPGIGEKIKNEIYRQFENLDDLKDNSLEEIKNKLNISYKLSEKIKNYLESESQ